MSKKILMLHGYGQSSQIFSGKTGGLRKSLQKAGYETIYVNAPLRLTSDQLHNSETDSELFGWWPYGESDYDEREGIDEVLNAIKDYDDVEGIIGFSQGAGLSGYITAQYQQLIPSLKFAIFFSGFRLMPERFNQVYENKVQIPSLHVIGELDTVVDEGRSMALYNASIEDTRTLLKHQGGHFVPNSKSFVTQVLAWISGVTTTETPNTKKNEIDDDDMFAAIDNMGKA